MDSLSYDPNIFPKTLIPSHSFPNTSITNMSKTLCRLSVSDRQSTVTRGELRETWKSIYPGLEKNPKTAPDDHASVDNDTKRYFRKTGHTWHPDPSTIHPDMHILYPSALKNIYGVDQVSNPAEAKKALKERIVAGTIE